MCNARHLIVSAVTRPLSSCAFSHHIVTPLFLFKDSATTEISTLSLHDALPISDRPCSAAASRSARLARTVRSAVVSGPSARCADRKSTRLNSSHEWSSYAVFCLKKKRRHQRARKVLRLYRVPVPELRRGHDVIA